MSPTMPTSTLSGRIVAIDKSHLEQLIRQHMEKYTEACDLNHIDVSRVTEMRGLFAYSFFKGDVSRWNVSGVKDMSSMFCGGVFNGNIANWDVSNVECMNNMFESSHFRGSLAQWDTGQVQTMESMFRGARFNSSIGDWNVSRCTDFSLMFRDSQFNQDISQWDVRNARWLIEMFYNCPFSHDVSRWKLPLSCWMLTMFSADSPGIKAQRSSDWHAKLHLDNGSLPPPGPLLDAFNELRSIHDALDSSNAQRARDIVGAVVAKMEGREAGPAEGGSWTLPELM